MKFFPVVFILLAVTFLQEIFAKTISITIICDIDSSKIYIDNQFKSLCSANKPINISISTGEHKIEVEKVSPKGFYYYFVKRISVREEGKGNLTIKVNSHQLSKDKYYYNYYKRLVTNTNNNLFEILEFKFHDQITSFTFSPDGKLEYISYKE